MGAMLAALSLTPALLQGGGAVCSALRAVCMLPWSYLLSRREALAFSACETGVRARGGNPLVGRRPAIASRAGVQLPP